MMRSNDHRQSDELDRLVTEYIERLNAGERVEPAEVLLRHPRQGEEILAQLELFVGAASNGYVRESEPLGTLGDYTLRRQIGRGGMGVVYEAWQNSMDRQVALKVLPKAIAVDTRAVARFIQEAQLAGKLSHPNIVHVHGMGVEEHVPYFAMEFVEGETLAQVLARLKDAEPEAETPFGKKGDVAYFGNLARAFADAADGLQHAHSKGIIHRDIKPSNLILDKDGRLRILDFGLARLEGQESLTISGDVVGTPLYMSPEQARRKKIPVDHRTDVYSLGATLYEMLTLQPPFRGRDKQDTLSQIIERDPEKPRKGNPRIPRDLETIALKCLRKEPADRYRTAEALGQDLRRFVRGDPIEARPEAGWEMVARRLWRRRIQLAAIGVLFVLLAVIGWLVWSQSREKGLRALADYRPAVLRAIEKLQAGSLRLKAESGETLSIDPRAEVFGSPLIQDLSGQTLEPLQAAVRELGDAIAAVPSKPDAWYNRARGRFLLGDLDGALADLDAALGASPTFLPASMLQATIHDLRGEKDVARRRRERALSVDGGWQVAWLSARQAMTEKRWDDAAKSFGILINLGAVGQEPYIGATIEGCLGRAGAMLELKDAVGALQHIAVARYLWPTSVEPALLEAKALWVLGDVEKAEQVFRRTYDEALYKDEVAIAVYAICLYFQADDRALDWAALVRTESVSERLRAGCFLEIGRCEEAVEAAKRAIKLDSRDAYAHLYLAVTLYDRLGRYQDALVELEHARELLPESYHVHFQLGRCFWSWGKLDQAIEQYRRATELNPKEAIARADLALILILQGKRAQGEPLLKEAVEMDPWNPYVHNDSAIGLELLGRERDAVAACDDAIRVNPQLSWPYARRGRILEKNGKVAEAIEEYRKACPLTPGETSHWVRLGRLLEMTDKPEEALTAYIEAIDMDLMNAGAHCHIAKMLRKHGLGIAGPASARLRELLDGALERALQDLEAAEAAGRNADRLVASLAWILSSLQAIQASDQSPIALLSRLPPYAAIDALLAFDERPAHMKSESAQISSRAGYLEAKILQRSGQRREAAAKFAEIVAVDPASPEPALALAMCVRPDDPTRAESELRKALAATRGEANSLWDLWAAICLKELRHDPARLLENLPAASDAATAHAEDIRWLLGKLRDGTPILINCGGDDYTSHDDKVWSRDRFFTGGSGAKVFVGEIVGTEADPLYQSRRCFPEELQSAAGYRLPLPVGRYRVRLHFAEVFWRIPGTCRFDVRIEGRKVLADFEPIARGFATAAVESFVTTVDDGLLDIEMVPLAHAAVVSAIEIEGIE